MYCGIDRSHDDIAALKRLLREIFTAQLSFDKRIKALEPKDEALPTSDAMDKLRSSWTGSDQASKTKIELKSGSLGVGSALLYSKVMRVMFSPCLQAVH